MLEIIIDSIIDCMKLLPFLYLSYLLVEYAEHKMSPRTRDWIYRAGKAGPILGALIGVIPQCGFSAAAAGLFAGGMITPGTLLAVFLSTSDEMLPIMISEGATAAMIGKILITKVAAAIIIGLLTDFVFEKVFGLRIMPEHLDMCEREHCGCEHHSIWYSSLMHTLQTALLLFGISLVIGFGMEWFGENQAHGLFGQMQGVEIGIAALIGMVPNCAASVLVTKLFLEQLIGSGALFAGLLCGAGTGLIVLYRENRNLRQNILLTAILYFGGVVAGQIAGILVVL